MELKKLQSLVELDLFGCSELGCLFDSIVDLSQLKIFRLWGCHKVENLRMEFGKLQSLVELDLSSSSELGVYPIQLWTCHNSRNFDYVSAKNWRIC
jgi:hypothetical protein